MQANDRLARARLSLEGLSVGDAFGERFFGPVRAIKARLESRDLPPGPWHFTDDTEMCTFTELLADWLEATAPSPTKASGNATAKGRTSSKKSAPRAVGKPGKKKR